GKFKIREHGLRLEDGRFLELAPDAESGDLRVTVLQEINGLADVDGTAVAGRLAGADVHQRGLAGAVGTNQAAQFAVVDVEVEIVEGTEAVEADRQSFNVQDDVLRHIDLPADPLRPAKTHCLAVLVQTLRESHAPVASPAAALGPAAPLSPPSLRRPAACNRPARPRGRTSVTTTKTPPSRNNQLSGISAANRVHP